MIAEERTPGEPLTAVQHLRDAINAHDLEALVACFARDYCGELPLHPARDFRGAEQVRRNWAQILAGVPDLNAELVRTATNGNEAWAEWEWTGTRRDGLPHLMRGTTIVGVEDGMVAWSRFYMEPVVDDGVGIDGAVRAALDAQARNAPSVQGRR